MGYRPPAVFSNNTAIAGWIFAVVFTGIVALVTFVLFRDGPPGDHSPLLMWCVMAFFWMAVVALWTHVVGERRVRVEVGPGDRLCVIERTPFSRHERRFRLRDLPEASVVNTGAAGQDDDYFHTRIALPDGSHVHIDEGHSRAACEASLQRFNLAAGRQ